jgi:hypothetical protein
MAVFKRGNVWWYEFIFAGRRVRESAKSSRKTVAVEAERNRRLELEKTLAAMPAEKRENRIRSVSDVAKAYEGHYRIITASNRFSSPAAVSSTSGAY